MARSRSSRSATSFCSSSSNLARARRSASSFIRDASAPMRSSASARARSSASLRACSVACSTRASASRRACSIACLVRSSTSRRTRSDSSRARCSLSRRRFVRLLGQLRLGGLARLLLGLPSGLIGGHLDQLLRLHFGSLDALLGLPLELLRPAQALIGGLSHALLLLVQIGDGPHLGGGGNGHRCGRGHFMLGRRIVGMTRCNVRREPPSPCGLRLCGLSLCGLRPPWLLAGEAIDLVL